MIHPISQSINLPPGLRTFGVVLLLPVISVTAQSNQQSVVVAPGDEKTVGFATENPGDTYQLDVTPGGGKKFKTTGNDDNILGENSDGALWQRVTNTEQLKRFKVTSANIHQGHDALFNLEFKKDGGGGGGGGGSLADAYVKAVNCFVKIHTPGTIAAPGTLIPAPTQAGKPYTGILQRNTDDEITAGVEDCASASKTGTGLTADNDLVKVELSWNPATLKPGMMKGKTLTLILPPGAIAYRDDGSQLTQFSVIIGSGGSGQLAQLASTRKQNIFLEGNGTWNGGDVVLKVDGLDSPGAQGKAQLKRVQIDPEPSMINNIGNLVASTKTVAAERHFVTPKKSTYINDDYVILEAKGVDADVFSALLKWDGGEAYPGDVLKRRVKRDVADKVEVEISLLSGGLKVDKLNVWKVWSTLTGNVQKVQVIPYNINGVHVGDEVFALYDCSALISPITLTPASISATTDIPDFRGAYPTPPPAGPVPAPGGNNAAGEALSDGATKKWDMTRRIARTINIVATPALTVSPLDTNIVFPTDTVVGNDDANVIGEMNDPYSSGGHITSTDRVTRRYSLQGGHIGATYSNITNFQEFARLDIGGKWYNISDPEDWGVTFTLAKGGMTETDWGRDTNGDGDMNDVLNEHNLGGDANGDGDQVDDVSRWRDNGSVSHN